MVLAVVVPMSRKPRDMGHPRLGGASTRSALRETRATRPTQKPGFAPSFLARLPRRRIPAPHGYYRPDRLHNPKRPRALQESVHGRQRAGNGKSENELGAAAFQRVGDQHRGDREQSK